MKVHGSVDIGSVLNQQGTARFITKTVTADYVITDTMDHILILAPISDMTITLPSPINGRSIILRKTDVSNPNVTIQRSGSALIEGTTQVKYTSNSAFTTWLIADGINWHRLLR